MIKTLCCWGWYCQSPFPMLSRIMVTTENTKKGSLFIPLCCWGRYGNSPCLAGWWLKRESTTRNRLTHCICPIQVVTYRQVINHCTLGQKGLNVHCYCQLWNNWAQIVEGVGSGLVQKSCFMKKTKQKQNKTKGSWRWGTYCPIVWSSSTWSPPW